MGELELSVKLKLAAEQFVSALSGATSQFKQAMGGMEGAAAQAGDGIDAAFKTFGIRSLKAIEAEISQVESALVGLKKSGVGMDEIARATDAATARVKALKAEAGELPPALTKAEVAAKNLASAFGALNIRSGATIKAEVDKIRASFATLRDSDLGFADKERASLALNTRLRELGRELGSVSGQAKASGSAMQQAGQSSQAMSSSLAHAGHIMAELYVAWAALNGAFRLSKSILDAGIGLDKIMAQLQFATGSAAGAAGEMAFVRAEAERLGIDVGAAGAGFAKFAASVRGSSLEGQKAREVFSGVADAAKVMQLSADETKGIFLALSQMMAKGKVQAEEFRGQLGDRLPIATSVAAKALGVTTAEFSRMLDAGELLSEDFLPKFAAALKENVAGALPAAVNTLDAQLARLGNSWTLAMQEIAKSGAMSEVAKIAEELAAKIRAMSESGELQKFGKEFADAMKTAGEAIVGVTTFVVEHAEAIKGLLFVYATLRGLSFAKSMAEMAAGLLNVAAAATTATGAVGGVKTALASLPARVFLPLTVAVVGIEIYQQLTGFIDDVIKKNREQQEASRAAATAGSQDAKNQAAAYADASAVMDSINAKYFAGSDQSAMATSKIIGDFRKLTAEAKGTGQALDEMVKKVNFSDQGSVNKMLASMDTLKRSGLVTGNEIRDSIGGALAKLSTKDFIEFQNAAVRAFDGSVEGARKLAIALDASLSAGFKKLGGDIDKFRSGIDQATKDAIVSFDLMAQNAQASGREIGEAFNLALKTADTRQEVEALGASLKKAAADGVISGKDLEDAQTRLQAKLRETAGQIDGALGDSFKRLGIKSAEAMKGAFDQLVIDFNRIKESGKASAEGVDAAYQKIKSSVVASIQAMTTASREALQAAKDHTSAVQAGAEAVKSQATAMTASANAQKADAEYAQASTEAMKSGSAAAREKADALGIAAQAAHAAADAAQADATASWAAAEAARAEEAAKKAIAAAAANPNEWTKQAAVAAQNFANETARGAEEAKQAAINAQAVAAQMSAAASAASAMASAVSAASAAGAHYASNAALDAGYFSSVADAANEAWRKTTSAVQGYIDAANSAGQQTAYVASLMKNIMSGAAGTGDAATSAMRQLESQLHATADATRRNEDATRAWQSAMDSLINSAASLKDELDRALGNDKAIEDRAYAERKRALKEQYDAAMGAAGGETDMRGKANNSRAAADARTAYASAISDLDKLHNIKLKDIADAAKAKSVSDQKNHQDELARIAEEKAARETADVMNRLSLPKTDQTTSSAGSQLAQDVAGGVSASSASLGAGATYNQTLNITTTSLSGDEIRRTVAPTLNKMMSGSR
ncbi:MAG: tape measure protein [Sterolibacterium sp.]